MKKRIFRIILALLVTLLIFFVFFRKTGWGDVRRAFAAVPLGAVGLYMVLSLLGTAVRSIRFGLLLSGRVGRGELFLITLVQNFSVDLLPARSASLVLYTYLTRQRGILLEEGASSFVVAVLYDALALGLMLGAAALFLLQGLSGEVPASTIVAGLAVIVAVSVFIILLAEPLSGWARKTARRMKFIKVADAFAAVAHYFSGHRALSERAELLGLSFVIKLAKYISLFVLFVGATRARISFPSLAVFSFGVAGAELSSFLPIQGLAGLGTWEAAFALVAGKIGLSLDNPFLTALVIHLVTQVWEYGLGLGALWILSVRAKRGRDSL